jgi:hypothetical protein
MKLGGKAAHLNSQRGTRNAELGLEDEDGLAGASPHRVLVSQPAGANNRPDLRRSTTTNNVKERLGGSDKSLLKLYYFLTGSGFF